MLLLTNILVQTEHVQKYESEMTILDHVCLHKMKILLFERKCRREGVQYDWWKSTGRMGDRVSRMEVYKPF